VDVHLVDLARAAQADLLVVGTHQRHGLERWTKGSVSRGVLRHAPMSVACVPTSAVPAPAPSIRPCRRVLAAADLTENGGIALPYAYSVVDEGGTVSLVHAVKPFRLPNPLIGGMPDVLPSKRENAQRVALGSAHLRAHIPAEAETRRIQTEVEIIEDDDAARAICQAAESFNADLVCVGAHARPGAAARVMGSVALGVLQHCRRPVLVVWPPVA
jgi:nucleotide-binding universal stress UspA family protein